MINPSIVPETLERAFEQCSRVPTEGEVLDRLYAYLRATRPTTAEIKDVIMAFYTVESKDIESRSRRTTAFAFARHMICYFCSRYTHASASAIGKRVGYGDHSTVNHAMHRITGLILTNAVVKDDIELIKLRLCERVLRRPTKVSPMPQLSLVTNDLPLIEQQRLIRMQMDVIQLKRFTDEQARRYYREIETIRDALSRILDRVDGKNV